MPMMLSLRLLIVAYLLYGVATTLTAGAEETGASAAAADDEHAQSGGLPHVARLPTDQEMEAAHARIGKIEVQIKQIFDLDDPRDNNWLFRAADDLHVRTRASAIRAQLLFRSGDLYSRRLLNETARNMRENSSFLREPQIRPIAYHDNLVDIEVVTHDVWTLQPGISFGRSGGTNSTSFDFADTNFLGFGKALQFGHSEDVDRSSTFGSWYDPNVWGSHWNDSVQYAHNSDGRVWGLALNHPFYALETLNAGGVDVGENRGVINRYRLGDQYDSYIDDYHSADIYAGKALRVSDLWTERLLLGWRVDRNSFAPPSNGTLLALLPGNRNLSYPFTRMQWVENHYETTDNLDQIARTEDVHFGLDASLGAGYATPAFGSDRRSLLVDSEINYGWHLGPLEELFVSGRLASRFEDDAMHDAIITWSSSYYVATTRMTRLLVRFTGDAGHDLDGDHTLQLGGDTGLRGYPLRYQNGNQRALFTIEERLYTNVYLFRLVNLGAAAFYDMGRTWGTTLVPTPQLGLLKDIGAGLRLGNARSSFGNVVHIDLAFPLDRQSNISSVQFLVSTQQSF